MTRAGALNAIRPALRATMDAKDGASYIGCSYWKILELAKAGKIPHIRAGNRVLFRKDTLDSWMTAQETSSLNNEDIQGYGKLRTLRA